VLLRVLWLRVVAVSASLPIVAGHGRTDQGTPKKPELAIMNTKAALKVVDFPAAHADLQLGVYY